MDKDSVAETSKSAPQATSSNTLATIFKYVAIGTGIAGIGILVAVCGFLLGQRNDASQKRALAPVQTTAVTLTPTPTAVQESSITDTGVANQKRYTNPRFGISFVFATTSLGEPFDVKESGNKIYVYDTKYPYIQGQYVEAFQKDAADTLDQAIQKQFLSGISPKDCFVKNGVADAHASYPASYAVKTIGYPINENSDAPFWAQANKCPEAYTETNGIAYFLGDTKHPKTYLFFSIGQQAFPIEENSQTAWQDTIQFLN